MSIEDLLTQTLSQPNVFWSAISAIAAVLALLIVVIEIPKFRKELATQKVQGLEYIRGLLLSDDFVQARESIRQEFKEKSKEYPQHIHEEIILVMFRLDFVSKLINIGFLDKDLFAYIFSDDLVILDYALRNFEHRDNSKMIGIEEKFSDGHKLITYMASKSWSLQREVADRIFKRKKEQ